VHANELATVSSPSSSWESALSMMPAVDWGAAWVEDTPGF